MDKNNEKLHNPFLDYNSPNDEDDDKTIIMDFEQENLDELISKKQEENTFTDLTHTNINIQNIQSQEENKTNKLSIHNPIKELILKYNLLTESSIEEMEESNTLNLDSLINSFAIDSTNLYKLLSKELSIKLFSDENELIELISDKTLDIESQRSLGILSIVLNEKEYFLISNPFDYELRDYLKNIYNKKVNFALCKKEVIKKAILKYIKDGDVKFSFSLSSEDTLEILDKDALDDLEYKNEGEVPIIPLVNYIILNAYESRASDIHVEPTVESLTVRYRIDGVLRKEINLPNLIHKEIVSRVKIIAEMNVAEKRLPQDGRFSLKDKNNKNLDIRVSTFPTVYGEKLVMRLLEQDALKPSLEELNLSYSQLQILRKKINSPYGLILISGPTGSGKTTTLYSALSNVDNESLNVLTVEDPVEYKLDGVHQMQVNEKIGLTFASGLRSILRQDPDVLMVGEIRDLNTANMAIKASLTGHIVFSTIHTNDAVGVIVRLVNMGVDPFLVASSVSLTIAQRLVRKICPHCADVQNYDELLDSLLAKGIQKEKVASLGLKLDEIPDFVYGRGCNNCRGTGYLGRTAVFEFFEPNKEVVQEILKPVIDDKKIKEICKQNGMKTLIDSTWDLVVEGVTTVEEIIRVIGE